ncbi:PAS domain-containing protein [Streptomyces sp. DT24]|uniref:hybrid sensor histidine kinase/response regulator n=1 Tax=Streptomyces sp. DT24 TaxID=3416520 RepID=UPI003CF9D78D
MSSRPSRGAARLAAILDALPDGLLLVNCNGTVVNANTIALEMFETPGTALVGRGLLDLLPEFDSKLIPGSMRRPEAADEQGRTKPTRMIARRTDGNEYPVEVTSANLENGQAAYTDVHSGHTNHASYTGDELLMLVVRDLSGTVDTEAELARSQRQTEMILRAAAEGVVGTDTDGRVVLVNPAAAQILGFRASDLGGRELHTLVLHSRAEGEPFPYEESPLADTLRSGRKHRVRGQVLWSKSGEQVPVDLTTAPVRDGDQLVGAVMTFTDRRPYEELIDQHAVEIARLTEAHATELAELTEAHAAELADRTDRYAAELEEQSDLFTALAARHAQLAAVLGDSLRGPLEELREELSTLAADPAGQLWPEANQILHHLAAGYARMTTLVDNVLGYQRLDTGTEGLVKETVLLDAVVATAIDGAVELIGPGRAQFAVHAPAIEVEVDARRLATALAHLVADVAGIDSTGKARVASGGSYLDSTVVVAAAQRGEVVRIEVRGPYAGGDPVHEPIVRGIVRAHGGVLQTHEVPGMSGSAYVLEVPLGTGAGAGTSAGKGLVAADGGSSGGAVGKNTGGSGDAEGSAGSAEGGSAGADAVVRPVAGVAGTDSDTDTGGGRRRARRSSTDAFLDGPVGAESGDTGVAEPTGRRRARRGTASDDGRQTPQGPQEIIPAQQSEGSGRRRGRPSPAEVTAQSQAQSKPSPSAGQVARPGLAEQKRPAPEREPGQALALSAGPVAPAAPGAPSEGSVVTAAEGAQGGGGRPQLGQTVPPQGVPQENQQPVPRGEAVRAGGENQLALPAVAPSVPGAMDRAGSAGSTATGGSTGTAGSVGTGEAVGQAQAQVPGSAQAQPTGRRARRALSIAKEQAAQAEPTGPRTAFALPPADADRSEPVAPTAPNAPAAPVVPNVPAAPVVPSAPGTPDAPSSSAAPGGGVVPAAPVPPVPPMAGATGATGAAGAPEAPGAADASLPGRHDAVRIAPGADHTPPQAHPTHVPTGRRRARPGDPAEGPVPLPVASEPGVAPGAHNTSQAAVAPEAHNGASQSFDDMRDSADDSIGGGSYVGGDGGGLGWDAAGHTTHTTGSVPLGGAPGAHPVDHEHGDGAAGSGPDALRQPLPAETPMPVSPDSTQGRAFSVRTLGQGVPFAQPTGQQQSQSLGGAGRRRKLATPSDEERSGHSSEHTSASPQPTSSLGHGQGAVPGSGPVPGPVPGTASAAPVPGSGQLLSAPAAEGRSYAISAPDEGAEGPEPLDGPGGAVEVANRPQPRPVDDELPPEPLDNPRRLLVWPAPDVSTQQALSDRGYRPVIVHSREEVDAQIAAFPAALFVDPLTGPITRTALQSLRQAAVAAEVPVLVTAGLGQATREAAYGADPAVLLKALAPRDSEQHPPRVLLIEEHEEIALALTETLERRGMQVARAATDSDAVSLATRMRPNLVVMDLMQVRRRRAGIIDWLRANGQLNRTPLVVYTSAGMDQADLPKLSSGETVLFLAERSTSTEVQARIVDLLAKIGTN